MDNQYFAASTVFLIQSLFGLYILVVMLRLMLQWVRADFYNPISQFIVKITNPPLKPLRRIIPGWGGVDLASVLLLIALQILELFLVNLAVGRASGISGLFIQSIAELLGLLINIFVGAILIQVILSWVAPGTYNPLIGLAGSSSRTCRVKNPNRISSNSKFQISRFQVSGKRNKEAETRNLNTEILPAKPQPNRGGHTPHSIEE